MEKTRLQRFLDNKKGLLRYIIYIGALSICFLLFQQGDLFHTSTSSYAYLNGHFIDFYDYNKTVVKGNDYYALIYIIFAIWNIPLKIFGLMHDATTFGITLTPIELMWAKFLLVIFFFATSHVIYKIACLIDDKKDNKAKWICAIFATSPIAIFCVFIFGQYDIIGLFFTMIGIYYYIKKDYTKFSIAFSFAISLKFFAIVLFIPLVLLSNKKILQIIKYGVIGISATVIQILMYINNEAFKERIFSLASGKIEGLATFNLSKVNNSPYLVIGFCIICIYAYIKKVKDNYEMNRITIFICLASYSLLFSTVLWHPQWLIILMPFFALSYLYIEDIEKMYLIDIVGMFSYIYIVVNNWPKNVDVTMVSKGILRGLFDYIPLLGKDLFISKYAYLFQGVFFVYFFTPILVYYFNKVRNIKDLFQENRRYFYARLYIGIAIFVLPAMFCIFVPKSIAQKINVDSYANEQVIGKNSKEALGPITSSIEVKQSFVAEYNYLNRIDIKLATYARKNVSKVSVCLYDENDNKIASEMLDGEKIVDNSFYKFKINTIKECKGKKYYLVIKSDADSKNGIAVWASNSDEYNKGECLVNEKIMKGDLNIKAYYDIIK